MTIELKINVDVKPRGMASAYVEAPFDVGKDLLNKKGYKIISLEENAMLRIQEGKDAFVSQNGNWTAEDFNYIPTKGIYLSKVSIISENPEQATKAHRNGNEFYINDDQVQRVLADSVKIHDQLIPTNRFDGNSTTVYAFGKNAREYGKFLEAAGIKEMPIWLAHIKDKPFVRKVWFRYLGYSSGFDGGSRGIYSDFRARGVQNNAEGATKNLEQKLN